MYGILEPRQPWLALPSGTMSQEGYQQALQVVQQLRQQNESLREKNAELAEEVFVPAAQQRWPEVTKFR